MHSPTVPRKYASQLPAEQRVAAINGRIVDQQDTNDTTRLMATPVKVLLHAPRLFLQFLLLSVLVATVTDALDTEQVKHFRTLVRVWLLSTTITHKTLYRHDRRAAMNE